MQHGFSLTFSLTLTLIFTLTVTVTLSLLLKGNVKNESTSLEVYREKTLKLMDYQTLGLLNL